MKGEILTKEELKIVKLFANNLFNSYTILDIMHKIDKNSYNWIFIAVNKLSRMGIIKIEVKGKSNICSLNIDNQLSLAYLSIIEKLKISDKLPLRNIYELIDSIPFSYFTFIVAGSYANGNFTKKSDLDIAVIAENKEDSKKIFSILKNKGDLMIPQVHPYAFTKEEFLKMLLDREENYGKEIFRNHIIVFGAENYYLILREAIKNGFKG